MVWKTDQKNGIFLNVFLLYVLKSIQDIILSILQNCVNKKFRVYQSMQINDNKF